MFLSVTTYYLVLVGGLACAALALLLRRQELIHPAPGDIQAKGGLGHMLVGIFAGFAMLSIAVVALFATGIILPTIIAIGVTLGARFIDFGGTLSALYPFQLALAVAATLAALLLWLNIITLVLGDPNV